MSDFFFVNGGQGVSGLCVLFQRFAMKIGWVFFFSFKLQRKCGVVCSNRLVQMKVLLLLAVNVCGWGTAGGIADVVVVDCWSGSCQNGCRWNEALLLPKVVSVLLLVVAEHLLLWLRQLMVVMGTGIVVEHTVPWIWMWRGAQECDCFTFWAALHCV